MTNNIRFIGAAFPRTGTFSIKKVIEKLIPGQLCYHMHEVFRNPDHILSGTPTFLGTYSGTLDGPACLFWKTLAEAFPDAGVLLTLRDPDDWWESMSETIYRIHVDPEKQSNPAIKMISRTFFNGLLEGKFDNRAFATDVYRQYCDDVRTTVPAERLIEYRVRWEPLCAFLNCPVPDEPFPSRNSRKLC